MNLVKLNNFLLMRLQNLISNQGEISIILKPLQKW